MIRPIGVKSKFSVRLVPVHDPYRTRKHTCTHKTPGRKKPHTAHVCAGALCGVVVMGGVAVLRPCRQGRFASTEASGRPLIARSRGQAASNSVRCRCPQPARTRHETTRKARRPLAEQELSAGGAGRSGDDAALREQFVPALHLRVGVNLNLHTARGGAGGLVGACGRMLGEQSPAVPTERPLYKSSIHPTRSCSQARRNNLVPWPTMWSTYRLRPPSSGRRFRGASSRTMCDDAHFSVVSP
jgi:hypothetical protein